MSRLAFLATGFRRAAMASWLASLAILPGPRSATAESDLAGETAVIAKQVKLLLDQKGQSTIAVGDFRAPAKLASGAGTAITKCMTDELKKLGLAVTRRAELELNGEFRDVQDPKAKAPAVQIRAHVVDQSGAEVVAFEPRGIFDMTTIASLVGATVSIPAAATEEQRNEGFTEAVENPKIHLANTRISPDPKGPYAIEVRVKSGSEYRPRAASMEDGLAFLKIRREETYAIALINDSPNDAAVTLTIDGLSVFAFSENTAYRHFIVPGKTTLTVPGWHRSNKVSDSFKVTGYAESAVAENMPNSTIVGTITACFAAAWPKDSPPPADEASPKGAKALPSDDATARGEAVEKIFTQVYKKVGRFRAAVTVRYSKDFVPQDLPGAAP